MRLLLDLGNTRLKWALSRDGQLCGDAGALAWDTPDFAAGLDAALAALPPVREVWLAVVAAPAHEAQVLAALQRRLRAPVRHAQARAQVCGVRLAYREPARMGIDRVLGLVAARAGGHAPCVLAALGTALTLDALDTAGNHLGGLIVAAPARMQRILCETAARVRPAHAGRIGWFAASTEDALASGAWLAAAALTEGFREQTAQRLGASPALLLSGGDAPVLAPWLRPPVHPLPQAVLRGLAVLAARPEQA